MSQSFQPPVTDADAQYPEGVRMSRALNQLLNNYDDAITPPVPVVEFRPASKNKGALLYVGPISASQCDRMHYLAQVTGMRMEVVPSRDAGGKFAFAVQLHGGDAAALEALVSEEPDRRRRFREAARVLERATGLPWCWDGLCLSTVYPGGDHPAHAVLGAFSQRGVTHTPYDISVFRGHAQDKAVDWITVHQCDVTRLKLISQEIGGQAAGHGR